MHRPNIKGMTAEQSVPIHDLMEFLHEALDAYDAIMAFRRGSGPVAVPWPAWCPAIPPAGVGPDICRWHWEDISDRGRALLNAACGQLYGHGDPWDTAQPQYETANFLHLLTLTHGKAYRLVRYAWFECSPERRALLNDWAKTVRALMQSMPIDRDELSAAALA